MKTKPKGRRVFLMELRRMLDNRSQEARKVAVARFDPDFAEWQRSRHKSVPELFAALREQLDRQDAQKRLGL